jgi:hypothetical protein
MVGENVSVSITQSMQEPRGPLDVGEQERDGSGRQLRHIHYAM